MPDDLVAGYRKNADLCRQAAERATDEIKKANWTKFAQEWLKLADAAEHSKTPARSLLLSWGNRGRDRSLC
jgi:hypothetical protein